MLMKDKNILFVINPTSGRQDNDNLLEFIKEKAHKYKFNYKITETTGENDQQRIKNYIQKYDPNIVIAAGGDGTVNLVAQVLIHTNIVLGILPLGSANGMAVELGMPLRINNALESILTASSKNIDILEINNQYISLHLSDIGMNARIIKRFEKEGVRGLYGYAKQFFKELRKPKRFYCTITLDGQTYTEKTLMVVLANATTYGTRAVVNPTGKLDDEKFEIVIIKPYPKWYIFKMFLAFFTGNLDKLRKVKILQGKDCKIEFSKPHELQIDGDLVGEQREVVAKILKHALKILVPK